MPVINYKNDIRYERFCNLIIRGVSPAKAYHEAGFSKNGACANANRLIKREYIQKRLEELKEVVLDRTVRTVNDLLELCWEILEVNTYRLITDNKYLEDHGKLVESITLDSDKTVKSVKVLSKVKIIELIGRHLDAWNESKLQDGEAMQAILRAIKERVDDGGDVFDLLKEMGDNE